VTLPTVASGETAVAQVRAWDTAVAVSYDEARALGQKFGGSEILQVVAGTLQSAGSLTGLTSFNLQVGLPHFNVGTIEFQERLP